MKLAESVGGGRGSFTIYHAQKEEQKIAIPNYA